MAGADRRERERQIVRRRILSIASEIIRVEGYQALTIRKIAAQIEYSPMALYSHFRDKNAILFALADEVYRKLEDVLPRQGKDSVGTLRKAMLLYIDFGLKHAEEYQLVFMSPLPLPIAKNLEQERVAAETAGERAFGRLTAYVEACVADEKVSGEPHAIATILWAGIHGVVSLLITQTCFPFGNDKEFAERTVDVLLSGTISPMEIRNDWMPQTKDRVKASS